MKQALFIALMWTAVATSPLAPAEPPQRQPVRKGQTQEEVRQALRAPQHVSRLVLFRRHLEQWHYSDPTRWVEFNCVRGEEPYVQQVHTGD